MTRDDFTQFLKERHIDAVFYDYCHPYPSIKVFCSSEDEGSAIHSFLYKNLPAMVGFDIITSGHHLLYTLPTFTIRDHLKDCFGWLI